MTDGNGKVGTQIDVEALVRRYEEERAKRIRTDGMKQYEKLTGRFEHLSRDRHADPEFSREPVTADAEVVIVGGGLGGLLVAARLHEKGVTDVRIVERAADFGGTWYWNRYPGAACDVESYVYMPLLEETGYVPREKYAGAPEIFAHAQRIGRHYDLYDKALFQTGVTAIAWQEDAGRWIVETDRGDSLTARFVVSAKGLFTNPKLPAIPGIESFAGEIFHTSRWNYDYTGGEDDGELDRLADKVVGTIGTGSTGLQCIPPLARHARELLVFQRTPASVDTRGNRPTDADWEAGLRPGWQRERMENFTYVTAGVPQSADMVADSWTDILRDLGPMTGGAKEVDPQVMLRAQLTKMENVRQRISGTVSDVATAEALKPYFHYFCKRPGFSDLYLDVFNRDNVRLVDTQGQGVERITPHGVVVAGEEYPVDCLVLATGFDFMTEYTKEAGFDIVGRGGRLLSEHWAHGARTLFGMQTHGFPNLFMLSLTQAGVSINYTHTAEEQAAHIAYVIGRCVDEDIATVEVTAEAEQGWVDEIMAAAPKRRAFLDACTPSYYNYEGRREAAFEQNEGYPGGPVAYYELLGKWRESGAMEGMATASAD